MRINTNIQSLFAIRTLEGTSKALSRALQRLASGKRINSAGDDAAGLAISEGLKAATNFSARNIQSLNEAQGYLQVADGILSTQQELVARMKELATQAANGTLSSESRSYLSKEFETLYSEFNRLLDQSEFRGEKLFDPNKSDMSLRLGSASSNKIAISTGDITAASTFYKERTLGSGSYTQKPTVSIANSYLGATGDFNGDGKKDFATITTGEAVAISFGNGDGTFAAPTIVATGLGGGTGALLARDVDGDGKMDLIANRGLNGSFVLLKNQGAGTFTSQGVTDSGGGSNYNSGDIDVADLNGDGALDLIIGSDTGNQAIELYDKTSGRYVFKTTMTAGSATETIADVDKDGILDVVLRGSAGNTLAVARGNGDGTFGVATAIAGSAGTDLRSNPVLQDIDGDGDLDLIVSNNANYREDVYKNDGSGNFTISQQLNLGAGVTPGGSPDLVDVNNDGTLDMVVHSLTGTQGVTSVYLNSASGIFTFSQSMASASTSNSIVPFTHQDINGDGYQDLIRLNEDGQIAYFTNKGNGTFSSAKTLYSPSTGSYEGSLLSDDFNGDGLNDLIANGITNGQAAVYILNSSVRQINDPMNIKTQAKAQDMLEILDNAQKKIASVRATGGAQMNRLEIAANLEQINRENLSAANSQISDTDVAAETSELTRLQILQKSGVAVLGQANVQMQLALALLK